MTRAECDQLIEDYVGWLRKGLTAERIGDWCELTVPFLDRHNDELQVYARRDNGVIVLTDDGATLADLEMSGVNLTGSRRQVILTTILKGLGVKQEQGRLEVEASPRNIGQRVHHLVQAMLAVNDMFVLAQPRVESLFWEDVRAFLEEKDIRYSPMVKLSGKSGFDHGIDFLIPRSRARPERLIQAINAPRKSTISHYLFVLQDTRGGREEKSEAYAFLNDEDREVGGDVIEALENYDVSPVLWSRREERAAVLTN